MYKQQQCTPIIHYKGEITLAYNRTPVVGMTIKLCPSANPFIVMTIILLLQQCLVHVSIVCVHVIRLNYAQVICVIKQNFYKGIIYTENCYCC